ncbi:MAG: hypothetical protein H0U95_15305 [Bacteroidetes bacterium]|nr:hypothetical protein [Bacteroidota bacterium]
MKKIFFIKLLLFSLLGFSQPPTRFFTKFGGNGVDIGYSAKPIFGKKYIVTGSTSSYGAGNTDVYLIKVDSMGFSIWQKTFGGFNNDVGKSVIQLPDSGFVIAGFTNSFGNGGYDVYLIRTDKNGNLIWQKTFGGTDWDFGSDVVLTPDGDIAVVGNTSSFGHGKKDGLFLKYDFLGNLVAQKFIGGVENEELRSIIQTSDFYLATVGYTESKGEINGDCYFLKLDLSGDTIFTKTFGAAGKDYANDLMQKSNDDYFICGAKTYTSNPKTQSLEYTITSTGNFLWEGSLYDGQGADEEFFSTCQVGYHPTYNACVRNRPISGFKMQESIFIGTPGGYYYKISENGGIEDEFCYSVEPTSDGGYITVGVTNSFGSLNGDIYFLKQDTTLINNSSVVGLKKNANNVIKPVLRYLGNNELEILMENSLVIKQYKLTSVNGDILCERKENTTDLKLNLNDYPATLLILEIHLENGCFFYYKIQNFR